MRMSNHNLHAADEKRIGRTTAPSNDEKSPMIMKSVPAAAAAANPGRSRDKSRRCAVIGQSTGR